jgi:hypothetical protein
VATPAGENRGDARLACRDRAVWFARQNVFEWKFNPLLQPRFVQADQATFVQPPDLVLAVSVNGESVAYPIRQLAYHHVVNDVVGGMPLAATY